MVAAIPPAPGGGPGGRSPMRRTPPSRRQRSGAYVAPSPRPATRPRYSRRMAAWTGARGLYEISRAPSAVAHPSAYAGQPAERVATAADWQRLMMPSGCVACQGAGRPPSHTNAAHHLPKHPPARENNFSLSVFPSRVRRPQPPARNLSSGVRQIPQLRSPSFHSSLYALLLHYPSHRRVP